jgi:hypothetical protein
LRFWIFRFAGDTTTIGERRPDLQVPVRLGRFQMGIANLRCALTGRGGCRGPGLHPNRNREGDPSPRVCGERPASSRSL